MVAALGATAARADDCGRRPERAPRGQSFNQGSYQLQTTQVWVPGQQEQVWVPGQCSQYGYRQYCTPGSYRYVSTAGHYENQQQWVWVSNGWDRQPPRQHGRHWRFGRQQHGAVPVGY